ncbi:MAG: VWA domain-containing protein [Acidimicrobiia bacterium]
MGGVDLGGPRSPADAVVAFVGDLRRAGLALGPDAAVAFARALDVVGPTASLGTAYWAGRATLVRRPEDVVAYDAAFARAFGPVPGRSGPAGGPPAVGHVAAGRVGDGGLPGHAGATDVPATPVEGPGPDRPGAVPAAPGPSAAGDPRPAAAGGPHPWEEAAPARGDVDSGSEAEALPEGVAGDDPAATGGVGPVARARWSAREVLRARDFATLTPSELAEVHRIVAGLRLTGGSRPSRRRRPVRGPRGAVDAARTARAALRTGGEPLRLARTGPSTRPRPLVLLCDVSGSMEPYARALVRFAQAAVRARRRVEVFALGTRLTRLTRELSARDPDAALAAAAAAVADWAGGTRLGETLRAFNDEWGVRGTARGATVVVLSDGWDRGDPALLAEQMARLRRVAHRLVWVNPLKATEGYEPSARGMAAALPWLDEFVEGHSLAALEDLAEVLGGGPARGGVR